MVFSSGRTFTSSLSTVRPPMPESNMPIGLSLMPFKSLCNRSVVVNLKLCYVFVRSVDKLFNRGRGMDREQYLKELEAEHVVIKRLFSEIGRAIERKDSRDIGWLSEKLNELKMLLLGHVYKEDEMLYKDLREEAVKLNQDALLPALDMFMESMQGLSVAAVEFFNKYDTTEKIRENLAELGMELAGISEAIDKRMKSEEGSLFNIYKAYFHL